MTVGCDADRTSDGSPHPRRAHRLDLTAPDRILERGFQPADDDAVATEALEVKIHVLGGPVGGGFDGFGAVGGVVAEAGEEDVAPVFGGVVAGVLEDGADFAGGGLVEEAGREGGVDGDVEGAVEGGILSIS